MQCGHYGYRAVPDGAEILEYTGPSGDLVLPETLDDLPVVSIGLCAFMMRTDITSLVCPDTLRRIGGSAFEGCMALRQVVLPDNLDVVEYHAFASCTALEEIFLPDTITHIGGGAFLGCASLRSVHLPAALTVLPMQLLMNCASLTSLTLPATLQRMEHEALRGCQQLLSLAIPDGVLEIGHDALTNCPRLNELTLPAHFSGHARDLHVGLGLIQEGDTLLVGSYLGQAEKGNTYAIVEYIGSDKTLAIPTCIEGCRVTKFNHRILEDMDDLEVLSIPAGFVVEPSIVPIGAQVVVRNAQPTCIEGENT